MSPVPCSQHSDRAASLQPQVARLPRPKPGLQPMHRIPSYSWTHEMDHVLGAASPQRSGCNPRLDVELVPVESAAALIDSLGAPAVVAAAAAAAAGERVGVPEVHHQLRVPALRLLVTVLLHLRTTRFKFEVRMRARAIIMVRVTARVRFRVGPRVGPRLGISGADQTLLSLLNVPSGSQANTHTHHAAVTMQVIGQLSCSRGLLSAMPDSIKALAALRVIIYPVHSAHDCKQRRGHARGQAQAQTRLRARVRARVRVRVRVIPPGG